MAFSTCNLLLYISVRCLLSKVKNIVRQKSKESALRYLMKGRGRKGKEIEYTKIEMAEYLQPMNKELTIENRRKIFEIRNMMVDIPSNFSSSEENAKKCACCSYGKNPRCFMQK